MLTKVLFLTLKIFSDTGGIEKVSRIAGKALYELSGEEKFQLKIYSLHDETDDINDKYFSAKSFQGFESLRFPFVLKSIRYGVGSDIVLLSHINLLPVGYLIKKLFPKTKIILLAHGIEVWEPLVHAKKTMLLKCDRILAVSSFTKDIIDRNNGLKEGKCLVLNNCLDPFLKNAKPGKSLSLLKRYGLGKASLILMTVSRISSNEKYKGYEKVITALQQLTPAFQDLKYIIVGKYDEEEKKRLEDIINATGVKGKVIFTGFIPDEELPNHFKLADVYIMPSKKEGFGISFIEAMFYGIPVIAGNSDGSADALCHGALGTLINPEDQEEITTAIKQILDNKTSFIPDQDLLLNKFSYTTYKNNLKVILQDING